MDQKTKKTKELMGKRWQKTLWTQDILNKRKDLIGKDKEKHI